jgi:hypothetical protein
VEVSECGLSRRATAGRYLAATRPYTPTHEGHELRSEHGGECEAPRQGPLNPQNLPTARYARATRRARRKHAAGHALSEQAVTA